LRETHLGVAKDAPKRQQSKSGSGDPVAERLQAAYEKIAAKRKTR
jgi:hypothetical protein